MRKLQFNDPYCGLPGSKLFIVILDIGYGQPGQDQESKGERLALEISETNL